MNAFETIKREAKSQALARLIWRHIPRECRTNPELAAGVAAVPQEERDAFAAHAGVKKPSEQTWLRVAELIDKEVADERRWLSLDDRAVS